MRHIKESYTTFIYFIEIVHDHNNKLTFRKQNS